jgi:hypothetical protein
VDEWIINFINKRKFGESRRFDIYIGFRLIQLILGLFSLYRITLRMFLCSDYVPH